MILAPARRRRAAAAGGGSVAFVAAGAGNASTDSVEINYPAGIVAGQLLLLHVVALDSVGVASITTPGGWTARRNDVSSSGDIRSRTYTKVADGSETGFLTVGGVSADVFLGGRMYSFSGVGTVESIGGALTEATGTTLVPVSVTTTGANGMAVQCFYAFNNTTVSAITGETGGDYTEAVAEYATNSPLDAVFSLQIAPLAAAGSISGGSANLGATSIMRFRQSMGLKP